MHPALPFRDRADAGRQLAKELIERKYAQPVVLALPRGGVPVAREVAIALAAPLDLVLVRKIGHPWQPELALAAVVDGAEPQVVVNEDIRATLADADKHIAEATKRELAEIERRRDLYLKGRERFPVKGKTAIVVDDGIATGATVRATLKALRRQQPAKLVLAVPVAPADTVEALRSETDEVVCLHAPALFFAISQFYLNFAQVTDEEVVASLASSSESQMKPPPSPPQRPEVRQ